MNPTVEVSITLLVKVMVSSKMVGTASATFRTDAKVWVASTYTLRNDSDFFNV